jgi:hypothetical protein
MNIAAAQRAYPAYDPVHLIGTVTGEEEGWFTVDCDGRGWRCRRAASCLLAPAAGDSVLISGPDAERVFLIAVIEQLDAAVTRIETAGDLLIASRGGSVALEGAAVRLAGTGAVDVQADAFALRARSGRCGIGRLEYAGEEVAGTVGVLRLVGRVCETVVDRLTQLSRNVLRLTEETEQVRAGTLDCEADKSLRMHAPYTVVTGGELVKMDAKQIHVG